jgi:hypothetical protein
MYELALIAFLLGTLELFLSLTYSRAIQNPAKMEWYFVFLFALGNIDKFNVL